MSPAPITRRALVAAAGAALGAAALPIGITSAIAAETVPTAIPGAVPLVFDPGAYVDDLLDANCHVMLVRDVPFHHRATIQPPHVCIVPPGGLWSTPSHVAVLAKWADAIDACPDHADRLVAHMVERTAADAS